MRLLAEPLITSWPVGLRALPATDGLTEAWRQAHFAAQSAAEFGKLFAHEQPDDSHSALTVNLADGALRSQAASAGRASLRIRDLELSIQDKGGGLLVSQSLTGLTLEQACGWVAVEGERAEGGPPLQAARPAPDLPSHALQTGAAFAAVEGPVAAGLRAVHDLYLAAAATLSRVREQLGSSPVLVWPHHFDAATLLALEGGASLGFGLAPPDALEPAGYWYVASPPMQGPPPALTAGRWHARPSEGPLATLSLDRLRDAPDLPGRERLVAKFLAEAFEASTRSLNAG